MRFQELVDALVTEPAVRASIDELLAIKRQASESEYGAPFPAINAFLDHQLGRLERTTPPSTDQPLDFSVLDRLLHDTVLSSDPAT